MDIRLFKMFNFASCSVMMFVLGIVLFSSTVLLPQFLQTLMGYTAQKAGMVISMAAIFLVFLLPLIGRLAGHFQARHLLAFGWITPAIAMYFSCKHIDLLVSFGAAAGMRIWQYLPVGFLFVPLTMAAYVGLPEAKSDAAAGLINFVRNIGQSVGTSAVTTLLARRSQYHQSVLAEHTRSHRFDVAVAGLTSRLTQVGLSMHSAHQQALARMYSFVMAQAQALSYVDIYWLLAATSAVMFLLCCLLPGTSPARAATLPFTESYSPMTLFHEIGAALLLIILTLWLQCAGLVALIFWVRRVVAGDLQKLWPLPSAALVVRLTAAIIVLHGLLILFWASCYRWRCFPSWESAFYFSASSYSTVGCGDVVLPAHWRMLGPLESIVGVLMCGISVSVLFATVTRLVSAMREPRINFLAGSLIGGNRS